MFRPNRFSSAWLCLHVCLNLKPSARMWKQFQLPECASCAQCAPEMLPEAADLSAHHSSCTSRDRARTWDARSNFDSGTSCMVMPYGQGTRTGGLRPEMVPRAAVPRRDIKSETRSVSYLFSLREGMDISSSADGQECPSWLISKGGVFRDHCFASSAGGPTLFSGFIMRTTIAATSERLMFDSGWKVPFASEPLRIPAR